MGSPLGVYDDDEITALSQGELSQLREAIILALRDEGILKQFLNQNPQIRNSLRQVVANNYQHQSKLRLKP